MYVVLVIQAAFFCRFLPGGFGYMEKDLCQALCQLRSESDAKTVVPPPPFVFEVTCLPSTDSKVLPLGCQTSSFCMYHQSGSQP